MIEVGCENHPLLNATLGQIAQIEAPDSVGKIANLDLTELAKRFSEGQVFRYVDLKNSYIGLLTDRVVGTLAL
jgi:hypothetical protein